MNLKEVQNEIEDDSSLDYQQWNGVDIMQSICMNCHEQGETRLMLHKIPYFRELIIASFYCNECGERNNEVTFGGEIQLQGCCYELYVTNESDLDRQLIKSDSALVRIAELDFEIPAMTQRGGISTIEGMLKKAIENLSLYQKERMEQMPEVGIKVAQIIGQLVMITNRFPSAFPFHIVVDDPAGNSFIENFLAPSPDPNLKVKYFNRTAEQDISLGLTPNTGVFKDESDSNFEALMDPQKAKFGQLKTNIESNPNPNCTDMNTTSSLIPNNNSIWNSNCAFESEVIIIPGPCPHCFADGESRTAVTSIPHFKEVIIMAYNCLSCGFRTNEVKGGGGVPTYGSEVILRVTSSDDLSRDLLKSDTAMVCIPELELELQHGTLGGIFTTVEGLLNKIAMKLMESNPFAVGDSSVNNHASENKTRERFDVFIDKLKDCAAGRFFPFSLHLRDPLGNSFISAPLGSSLPPEMDQNLKMIDFERSYDENEDLGLNDINTENYDEHGGEKQQLGLQSTTTSNNNNNNNDNNNNNNNVVSEIILPDRLKYLHKKGLDHPTPFALGTNEHEDTPGGIYFLPNHNHKNINNIDTVDVIGDDGVNEISSSREGFESLSLKVVRDYESPPIGWKASRDLIDIANPTYHSSVHYNSNIDHQSVSISTITNNDDNIEEEVYVSKRTFSEKDFDLKFIPREEFGGRREGYAFRLGAQGLGYYEDYNNDTTIVNTL